MKQSKIAVFFLVSVLTVCASNAQNQVAVKQWTLEECIRYAISNNIVIKQKDLSRESAETDLNTARNSRLPNLNAGTGQNWNFGRTQTRSGLYENSTQSNTSLSISSSMPLFTGFRIGNEIEKSRFDLMSAVENLESAKENLALNIASLFLQALLNRELLKVNEEQLKLTQTMRERTEILLQSGRVPESQLAEMDAKTAKDELSVVQAKNSVALSLLDLAQSLELENPALFDISIMEIDAIFDSLAIIPPPDAVFDNAVALKSVVKEQEYRLESAKRTLGIARSGLFPTLNLSAGYGTNYFYMYGKDYTNASLGNQLKNNGGEYVSLNLNIPIFNRFSVRNQIRNARLNIDNQQLALESVKKTLYREIHTAYLNAVAAMEKYRASSKSVEAASLSLKYTQEKYEQGKSTVYEYNEAKTTVTNALSEQIQSKYDYVFRIKILDFYNGKNFKGLD
ncbi:MAG: TolC family protein [Prevotellaceae bacterium]|jgi:outer membrane protein|nr:TolC family protein [Prevotellaceae bacterium]